MQTTPQETKIENLRVHAQAKGKVKRVQKAIQAGRGIKPTLSEALVIMADHFLATGAKRPQAA
jgi:hypothetical protein